MATQNYSAALDSDYVEIAIVEEDEYGVTPDNPAFQKLRMDSEGFSGSKSRTRPNEIDPAGQASAAITTKEEATGSLNCSVSAGLAYNKLIASALNGVWTTPVNYAGSDVAITAADGTTCTLTATAGQFTTTNLLVPGQMIKIFSAGSAVNCGIARVKTVAAGQLTLDMHSGTPAIANAATMGACTIKGSMLRNGTTVQTFTVEKKLTTDMYMRSRGSYPTDVSFDVGVGDYLKSAMTFQCKDNVTSVAALAGAVYTDAPKGTVIDSVKGIGTVWRGVDVGTTPGAVSAITAIVQKMSLKAVKEGAASQYGMGSTAAAGMRRGKIVVSGQMSTFFKDFDLFTQFSNEQAGPIGFHALDGKAHESVTKGYFFTFCNATIMNPKVVAGGPGQDVVADYEVEGNPDVSSTSIYGGKTIQIDYFG